MFTRVAEGKPLLPFLPPIGVLKPIMSAAASTAASIADPSASHAIAIVPLLPVASVAASVGGDTALDDADVCLPPTRDSSLLARLAHVSYTMYRARQVLRLGRWLYDIPDVRDSALELWRGHGEEKTMEEQEAEEEWESVDAIPCAAQPSRAGLHTRHAFAARSPSHPHVRHASTRACCTFC